MVTAPPKASCNTEYHCFKSARVGTTTSVLLPTRSIALTATAVFPAPVGRTTTPRSPPRRQASRASFWQGRGSLAERAPPARLHRVHRPRRLSRAGRQNHHAAEPAAAPGVEGLLLVGAGLHGHA